MSLENVNPTIRLRLRPDVEVALTGLPLDLTTQEGSRLKGVIDVFTIGELKIIEKKTNGEFLWEKKR